MPIYCYERPNGEIIEEVFRMGEAPEFLLRDGEHCTRSWGAEAAGQTAIVKGTDNPVKRKRAWPMEPCVASGVHEDDGPKLAALLKKHGCPTEVVGGDPIYTSAAHQKKALKIRGFRNRKSFG
jgi:hypothetical protein